MNKEKPLILAVSAASGFIYGLKLLEFLLTENYKVELIISEKAYYISKQELGIELSHNKETIKNTLLSYLKLENKTELLTVWLNDEIWANPASGSYKTAGMMIVPASMATVASISCGLADTLITRVADVMIKEGRQLLISPRETPFNAIHLENMLKLSKLGVKIVPPIVGFYANIKTLEDSINFVVGKILDSFGNQNELFKRWKHD